MDVIIKTNQVIKKYIFSWE